MALFQVSVLKSHLSLLNEEAVEKAYKKYQEYFWNTTIQENIKSAKEEQYQATFLNELFVNILGYTLFPNPNSNLTTEFKNEKNSRKADGALLNKGVAVGVIELKGTNTKDLESIRRQAFDYKANHKGCKYVITSNFEKLRFYINDATEFEEFDLFTLSLKRFRLLYLCLHKAHLFNNTPLKIKEASIAEEEEITKAFYKDYSIFKRELYRDLVANNVKTVRAKLGASENIEDQEDFARLEKNVKLTLFKKSQKLIDRFLFIFFAEDRQLLPSNSTLQILNKWKNDWDFGDERLLYGLFKQYFHFLDIGRKGTASRAEIYAYNGGLFKPDAILDALEINNDLLFKYTTKLSNYDFESQVGVNILGHIFENSLNEIENVNAEIEGVAFDKQTSKRKKDGVFYTPKYITKYIVENTVGKLCEEKKIELDFKEADYFEVKKGTHKNTKKQLLETLDTYREWLLQLTICDPACGSGAFLNQALDFLIKEHSYIDELKTKILGGGLPFPFIENTILENNIYGVDLNEESVEIAKLSLWLRTAQPRRKLNDLSSNIKCGNSLIDDKKVAGDKAFKWEKEFPKIFKSKDLKAYHITTAVHDSRTSDRMVKYKVRERRDLGTNPYPNVVYFTADDDLIISQTIAGIVKEDGLRLLAYNICADHMHLLLVCDVEEIPRIMQKIKSVTSKILTREHNVTREHAPLHKGKDAPLSKKEEEKKKPLWQQKYSEPKEITSEEQLQNTLSYIQNNRSKHELPEHSAQLQSIIEAMTMPEEEAFKKETTGGFDVVIGNPPYVVYIKSIFGQSTLDYVNKKYTYSEYNPNTYALFTDLALNSLLKYDGYLGFIIPNSWMEGQYFSNMRKDVYSSQIEEIVYLRNSAFDEVVETVVIHIKNVKEKPAIIKLTTDVKDNIFTFVDFIEERFIKGYNPFIFSSNPLLEKLETNFDRLKKHAIVYRGLETRNNKIWLSEDKKDENYIPILLGRDVSRYDIEYSGTYVNFIQSEMKSNANLDMYLQPKILMRRTGSTIIATKDENNLMVLKNSYLIIPDETHKLDALLAQLNSSLFGFYHKSMTSAENKAFAQFKGTYILDFPIHFNSEIDFTKPVNKVITLNASLTKLKLAFKSYFSGQYKLLKVTRTLEYWYLLDFTKFIKELNKAIKATNKLRAKEALDPVSELTKKDEFGWMELFEENKKKAQELQTQIAQTEQEIDQMVYELYGLTEDEIAIVESS